MDSRDFPLLHDADDKGSGPLDLGPACNDAQHPAPEVEGLPLPEPDGLRPVSVIEGLRVGLGSDSDSDDVGRQIVATGSANRSGDDLGPPLPWGFVHIADERICEREEAYGDRAVLSSTVGADEDGSVSESSSRSSHEWSDLEYNDTLMTLIRFVLGRGEWNAADIDALSFFGDDHEDDSDHETLFGQFVDQDRIGNTPAAKSVIERLPVVVLTEEDVANANTFCAVCKDEISLAEMARRLPCLHIYHGDCILPWLERSNTCPVCRYELPIKDPEYKN